MAAAKRMTELPEDVWQNQLEQCATTADKRTFYNTPTTDGTEMLELLLIHRLCDTAPVAQLPCEILHMIAMFVGPPQRNVRETEKQCNGLLVVSCPLCQSRIWPVRPNVKYVSYGCCTGYEVDESEHIHMFYYACGKCDHRVCYRHGGTGGRQQSNAAEQRHAGEQRNESASKSAESESGRSMLSVSAYLGKGASTMVEQCSAVEEDEEPDDVPLQCMFCLSSRMHKRYFTESCLRCWNAFEPGGDFPCAFHSGAHEMPVDKSGARAHYPSDNKLFLGRWTCCGEMCNHRGTGQCPYMWQCEADWDDPYSSLRIGCTPCEHVPVRGFAQGVLLETDLNSEVCRLRAAAFNRELSVAEQLHLCGSHDPLQFELSSEPYHAARLP